MRPDDPSEAAEPQAGREPGAPAADAPEAQDPALADEAAERSHAAYEVRHALTTRLTDRQAIAVIGTYIVLRQVTTRAGLAFLPALLASAPWAIPLLRNTSFQVLAAASEARGDTVMLAAIFAASLVISMVGAMVFYWAGARFGPQLAVRAEREGGAWAELWNRRRVERAHRWLDRWGLWAVAGSRATGALNLPVALVAGSSRMHVRTYAIAQAIGSSLWAAAVIWLGVRTGDAWPWVPERIKSLSAWSLRIGIASLVLLVVAAGLGRAGNRGGRT